MLNEKGLCFELGTLEKDGWVFDSQREEKELAVIFNFVTGEYEKRYYTDGQYEKYIEPKTYTRSCRPAAQQRPLSASLQCGSQFSAPQPEQPQLLNPEEYIKIIGNDVTVQLENSTFV